MMIDIQHLTKSFGRNTVVDDVSLRMPPGDSVALWGTNGAGKTTIIRCILGLFRYRGVIRIGGLDAARNGKAVRRLIGYVPQESGFQDDLGVEEAVRLFARLKGVGVDRVDAELAAVGLAGHEAKRVRELSGGMKQRLALAIALLADPPVLVLDEVTASLDAGGRAEFVRLLAGLSARGKTLLFASHRAEEIGALAKRVVILDRGKVTGECAPDQVVTRTAPLRVLHIHLPAHSAALALTVLRSNGFDASMNGVGVLVPVGARSKAGPLRILADANIDVSDFDVIGEHDSHTRPEHAS